LVKQQLSEFEDDDLDQEIRLLKKLKKGLITEEEYDSLLGNDKLESLISGSFENVNTKTEKKDFFSDYLQSQDNLENETESPQIIIVSKMLTQQLSLKVNSWFV